VVYLDGSCGYFNVIITSNAGRWFVFIYDKVLNARYFKKGTWRNIKIRIPKSQILRQKC
jgi:hypothetical protein